MRLDLGAVGKVVSPAGRGETVDARCVSFEKRDRICGHPAVLPVTNLSVQRMPNDSPIPLNDDELRVLSYGPRFIPVVPKALETGEWQSASALFEHRIAVYELFKGQGPPPARTVENTLVRLPYQRTTTGWWQVGKGPLRDAIQRLNSSVLREVRQAQAHTSHYDHDRFTNLTAGEVRAISTLRNRRDIVVRMCDKGLGPCVLTREWYNTAARNLLSDAASYEIQPPETTARHIAHKVHSQLKDLLRDFDFGWVGGSKASTESVFGDPETAEVARLYLLPKRHKFDPVSSPYPVRPIVADVNSATAKVSQLVGETLNEVINHTSPHPWVIKDTMEFLSEIATVPIEEGDIIFSWDVVALYPSIPHEVALAAVGEEVELWEQAVYTERIRNHLAAFAKWDALPARVRQTTPCPAYPLPPRRTSELITQLLRVVLENGYFSYGDGDTSLIYRQAKGICMGTSAAPPVANITMYHHMRALVGKWKNAGKLRHLKAFLDDGFGVFRGSEREYLQFLREANHLSPHIQFTETHSTTEVQFLDVTVFVGTDAAGSRTLCTRPYVKEWNKFLYIPPFSGHSPASLCSFIASETQRLVRNSSHEGDAIAAAHAFACHLLDRGYDLRTIISQMSKVTYAKRATYLQRKQKSKGRNGPTSTIALTLPYRPLVAKLRIPARLNKIQRQLGPAVRLVVGWKAERRLQDYLQLQWPQADIKGTPGAEGPEPMWPPEATS